MNAENEGWGWRQNDKGVGVPCRPHIVGLAHLMNRAYNTNWLVGHTPYEC